VLGLAACGGSPASSAGHSNSPAAHSSAPSSSSQPSTPIAGTLRLSGTVSLHGAVTEQKSFTEYLNETALISTCAEVGSKGTGAPAGLKPQFNVPTPAAGGTVYIVAGVLPYHGPGSYGRSALLAGGGTDVNVNSQMYNPLATSGTATVTTSANGSGTFAFTGATPVSPAKPTLSGTVSWTCSS
jgi:hypothetical protein